METSMSVCTLTFKCLGHTKRENGLISLYHLEVTDTQTGEIENISVKPNHLASERSMKRILLDRCMFYRATRDQHNRMLLEIFDPQPAQAESRETEIS